MRTRWHCRRCWTDASQRAQLRWHRLHRHSAGHGTVTTASRRVGPLPRPPSSAWAQLYSLCPTDSPPPCVAASLANISHNDLPSNPRRANRPWAVWIYKSATSPSNKCGLRPSFTIGEVTSNGFRNTHLGQYTKCVLQMIQDTGAFTSAMRASSILVSTAMRVSVSGCSAGINNHPAPLSRPNSNAWTAANSDTDIRYRPARRPIHPPRISSANGLGATGNARCSLTDVCDMFEVRERDLFAAIQNGQR